MNVATQTYISNDKAIQVPCRLVSNNVNLIIRETDSSRQIHPINAINNNRYPTTHRSNFILNQYHKEFNERGHSIFKWRDEKELHEDVAKKAVSSFRNIGVLPPHWLNRRTFYKKV
jgi:hypothetical protein